jgi:hypothetical protein
MRFPPHRVKHFLKHFCGIFSIIQYVIDREEEQAVIAIMQCAKALAITVGNSAQFVRVCLIIISGPILR